MVRNRNTHGDPDGDDSAVADPEAQSKSLGEHRRGHNRNCRCSLDRFHLSNLSYYGHKFLLFVLWSDRSGLYFADHLVRMEMAERNFAPS